MAYSKCGVPSILAITDINDNTLQIDAAIGTSGTDNQATDIELFITYDGTTPSLTNYAYRYVCSSFTSVSGKDVAYQQISFAELSQNTIKSLFGESGSCTIKVIARTLGLAGVDYYSNFTSVKSGTFTWHAKPTLPKIISPKASGETTGLLGYTVSWEPSTIGINNSIIGYTVGLFNVTEDKVIEEIETTELNYRFNQNLFNYSNTYYFYVIPLCSYSISNRQARSGLLNTVLAAKFTNDNFTIVASDGNSIPSTNILGDRTYVDIGSGTVLKLSWTFDILYGANKVDYYSLFIGAQSTTTGSVTALFNDKIGNVNEFYITSSLLSQVSLPKYQLRVYLKAHSIYGEAYSGTSNVFLYNVVKGCGTFTKVLDGYKQPIMKRALAFTNLNYLALTDAEGKALLDADGKKLYIKAAVAQDTDVGWTLMQNFYSKNSNNTWKQSDIRYEVLTDENGEIITDINNEPIYTL